MPPKKKKHNVNASNEDSSSVKFESNRLSACTCNVSKNLSNYFKNEEVQELKSVLKRPNLNKTPILILATILEKINLIEQLIKEGKDIHEVDENNVNALVWSIKSKKLQSIDVLLSNGADPFIRQNHTSDHILTIALETKIWDEPSMIKLWKKIKSISKFDVNFINKNGRTLLHMAVRRGWLDFIQILMVENVEVDITNAIGITPLMLACYRNNINIVQILIHHNADITKQDNKGFISVCYALSSPFTKNLKPPNIIVEILFDKMKMLKINKKDYVHNKIKQLTLLQNKLMPTFDMSMQVISYVIHCMENGILFCIELNIMRHIENALKTYLGDVEKLKITLMIVNELFKNTVVDYRRKLLSSFLQEGCTNVCIKIIYRYDPNEITQWLSIICVQFLVNCVATLDSLAWLRDDFDKLYTIFTRYKEKQLLNSVNLKDIKEYTFQLHEETLNLFEKKIAVLQKENSDMSSPIDRNEEETGIDDCQTTSVEIKNNSKTTKRRTKALKAKIAKIKSADLTERLSHSSRRSPDKKPHKSTTCHAYNPVKLTETSNITFGKIEPPEQGEETVIVDAIKMILTNLDKEQPHTTHNKINENTIDWKMKIKQLPFSNKYYPQFNLLPTKTNSCNDKDFQSNLNQILEYLYQLLQRIIEKYRKHWELDRELECNSYLNKSKDDKSDSVAHILQNLEQEKIMLLETDFAGIVNYVRMLSVKNPEDCNITLKNLEAKLLTHQIRGKNIMTDVLPHHEVQAQINYNNPLYNKDTFNVAEYMEQILNDKAGNINGIDITLVNNNKEEVAQKNNYTCCNDALYVQEMLCLPKVEPVNVQKQMTAKKKTLANMYHLMPSILTIVDSDSDNSDLSSENDKSDKLYTKSRTFFNKSNKFLEGHCHMDCSKFLNLKCCDPQSGRSRWSCALNNLEANKDCQHILGGTIKISSQNKRNAYVISTGGNFTPVELGLDNFNGLLAVKRIPSGSCVCKMIKQLVTPLLPLRNTNILHYYACDFDHNELIIATPLCEYNMGQYVMLMKHREKLSVVATDIVKQFLSGVMFLHSQQEAIVHGNLKPSNIFIDTGGVVKVAEFGTHKALFKLKEAPNSSIIWFSTETFQTFKQNSKMVCGCASDIQVSGMLIYFIVTGGKHAYGEETREILKNLEKGIPTFLSKNVELQDLLTWMLMITPTDRPNIYQVFSHVYFWNIEKKWHFILACAGLSSTGNDLVINLPDFHYAMDQTAFNDNIKGKWAQVVKSKIPQPTTKIEENDDSPSGLLRYIRACVKATPTGDFKTENDCCNFFINSFPSFALSLYRIIENTEWMDHLAFVSFYRM